MDKKRYAIVGVGSRSRMYLNAVTKRYPENTRLVAICDNNQGRLELAKKKRIEPDYGEVPAYPDAEFDRMVEAEKPDTVIVTTKDCFHDKYIVRAMELGCDAVTEKPMTTDEKKCQRIIDTVRKTGKNVRVTFNYRYSPARTQIKDLLMSGVIGKVLSVDFHWLLDTRHGADYFRRWHRNKENSGGLMVHKATHHFDLVNWWLSTRPVEVTARGARNFYVPATAKRLGLENAAERCVDCPEKTKCKFYLDIESPGLKELYRENEQYDDYFRDSCVVSSLIDIEGTMNLVVKYKNGVRMTYSLNAFCPKEGYEIRFNGTRGRLEHTTLETSYESGKEGGKVHETIKKGTSTWVFPHFAQPYPVEVWHAAGGHGGGDDPLLDGLFATNPPEDKYKRAATHVQGAWSILTGVSANVSMAEGKTVLVDELVSGLDEPDFPEMPEW